MKNVLFVGYHNAGRSQIAEAFANHIARERGLALHVASAGVRSGNTLNLFAEDVMQEVCIPLSGHKPKPLTQTMIEKADHVVMVGRGITLPEVPETLQSRLIDWDIEELHGQPMEDIRDIRDEIRWKIETLIADLVSKQTDSLTAEGQQESVAPSIPDPFAVLDPRILARRRNLHDILRTALRHREVLPGGILCAFSSEPGICMTVMDAVTLERELVPGMTVHMELPSDSPLLRVKIVGQEGDMPTLTHFLSPPA